MFISDNWEFKLGGRSRRRSMWYGVRAWGVRIKRREGDEGGNKRAEGGVGRLGRELWIWMLACILLGLPLLHLVGFNKPMNGEMVHDLLVMCRD